jgi:amino-acid N-acetyltransferase
MSHQHFRVACLYVHPSHENRGIGQKLVHFVEDRAREKGLARLLALSTQAFDYFRIKAGFAEGTPDDLPPTRRQAYDASGRRSKVLVKSLEASPHPR